MSEALPISALFAQSKGVIKSVQRGVIELVTGSSAIKDVTVAAVDMNKSVLNFLGTGGINASGGGYMALGVLQLLNATTVRATTQGSGGAIKVSFELVEYY